MIFAPNLLHTRLSPIIMGQPLVIWMIIDDQTVASDLAIEKGRGMKRFLVSAALFFSAWSKYMIISVLHVYSEIYSISCQDTAKNSCSGCLSLIAIANDTYSVGWVVDIVHLVLYKVRDLNSATYAQPQIQWNVIIVHSIRKFYIPPFTHYNIVWGSPQLLHATTVATRNTLYIFS